MNEWLFGENEVLTDREGYWWHVMKRLEDIDGHYRAYEVADATHTEYKTVNAEDAEGWQDYDGMFESAGWSCKTKPAAKRGVRVNGVLAGPKQVDYWRGEPCVHDYPCQSCGAEDKEVDILTTGTYVLTDCTNCDSWEMHEL